MGLSLTVSEINKQPNGLFVYEKATCGDCIWTSRTVMGRPIHCYKIVFGLVTLNMTDFFEFSQFTGTRGHAYKLYKPRSDCTARMNFFANRVINAWNNLPTSVSFTSLPRLVGLLGAC